MENILQRANEIVNGRREEKDRKYGSFSEGMEICAKIASLIRNKEFTAEDAYVMLIALKFSREHFNHKEDNLLDAVAYLGAWNNYINEKSNLAKTNNENSSTESVSGVQI